MNTSLAWGFGSLFLSGVSALVTQVIIQHHTTLVAGGTNSVILTIISFLFVAGLAVGGLASGVLTKRHLHPRAGWVGIEGATAVLCLCFLWMFDWIHEATFPVVAGSFGLKSLAGYYVYVFGLSLVTVFVVAFSMGMNWPVAFATLLRKTARSQGTVAIGILFFNTAGAAVGSILAPKILLALGLGGGLRVAALLYLAAGVMACLTGSRQVEREQGRDFQAGFLNFRVACGVIFLAGALGFAIQYSFLRIEGTIAPLDPDLYSRVIGAFLVFWCLGCLVAASKRVPIRLALPLMAGSGLLYLWLISGPGFSSAGRLLLLFPAAFTGLVYAQLHNEVRHLTPLRAAILIFFNLSGGFLGSLFCGVVVPMFTFSYYGVAIVIIGCLAYTLAIAPTRRQRLILGAAALVMLAATFFPYREFPHHRHLRQIYAANEFGGEAVGDQRFRLLEDWSSIGGLIGDTFFVGGFPHTPNVHVPLGGYRAPEVFYPSILRARSRMAMIGVSLGIANGLAASLNPGTQFVGFDFFQALPKFWEEYPHLNFDLIRRPNYLHHRLDGRLGLKLSDEKYDVVMEYAQGEGVRGVSAIKSLEFYGVVRNSLKKEGVFVGVIWSQEVARTLQQQFKFVYQVKGFPLLLASRVPVNSLIDPDRIQEVFNQSPELEAVIREKGLYRPGEKDLLARVGLIPIPAIDKSVPLVTDDHPLADYRDRLTWRNPQ